MERNLEPPLRDGHPRDEGLSRGTRYAAPLLLRRLPDQQLFGLRIKAIAIGFFRGTQRVGSDCGAGTILPVKLG